MGTAFLPSQGCAYALQLQSPQTLSVPLPNRHEGLDVACKAAQVITLCRS